MQVGTHFVVTKESVVHENYKKCIIKAKDIDSKTDERGGSVSERGEAL